MIGVQEHLHWLIAEEEPLASDSDQLFTDVNLLGQQMRKLSLG